MAGLVKREFRDPQTISHYADELTGFHGNQWVWSQSTRNKSFIFHTHTPYREGLMSWLGGEFSSIGLEVYHQNYTATRPAVTPGQSPSVSGQNIYGILRAGRSSSAESLVFSAPSGDGTNTHGLAVMLSLARYFQGECLQLEMLLENDVAFIAP